MRTQELYNELSTRTGLTKADSKKVVDELLDIIKAEVTSGGTVTFLNFATFACKEVKEREYRNPATGETFTKPAHREMAVKVSSQLKDI